MNRRSFLIGSGSILTTAFVDKADWFKIDNLPNTPPANISISGKLIEYYVKENS